MSKEKSTPTKYDRKAIYIGRRLDGKGHLQVFLLLPEKKEIHFKGIKRVWIGHTYKCSATKMSTRPERLPDDRVDDPAWEAQDALVDAENAKKRAEEKVSKMSKPQMRAAIEALRPLLEGVGYFGQSALVRHLVDQAGTKFGSKPSRKIKS